MSNEDKIYKQHYACFQCRKVFKKTNLEDAPKHRLQIDECGRFVACPQCGERMPDVGFDFEPSNKGDIRGWQEAERGIKARLDYHLRNSEFVGIKGRRAGDRFIRELEARRGVVY